MARPQRIGIWGSALAIALFQVIGSFGASSNQPERNGMDWLAVLLVLAGPAALAVRDRHPLVAVAVAAAAADIYIALGYAYGPIFLSVIVALFTAVLAGHRHDTWALAGGAYVGYVAAVRFGSDLGGRPGVLHLALVAGWLVVVLAVAEVVRGRRQQWAEQERLHREEEQRRISEQRLDLAQELHDVLAHKLSLINVQASVALHLIDEQPGQAAPALANIKQESRDALQELRRALDVLRHGDDAPRSPAPRLRDIATLVDGVRVSGLEVHLEQPEPSPTLPEAVERAAYRIVQEALTNTTRHAGATAVKVALHCDDDALTVEIVDNGKGITRGANGAVPPMGNGMIGMRERAASLGGTWTTGAAPGGGFRVVATIPVESA